MADSLPTFVYHPDPLATGSVVPSDESCDCCQRVRGYAYVGPAYGEHTLEVICPWCIADGTAHDRFGVDFIDRGDIGDHGRRGTVPDDVRDLIAYRTPCLIGWQQERWWVCCNDAAVFLGRAGKAELQTHGDQAIAAIRKEAGCEGDAWQAYFDALDKDAGPTAYVFRCRHCGTLGGYSDCH